MAPVGSTVLSGSALVVAGAATAWGARALRAPLALGAALLVVMTVALWVPAPAARAAQAPAVTRGIDVALAAVRARDRDLRD